MWKLGFCPRSFDTERETLNIQQHVTIEMYKFKPSLEADYERADMVISHAGVCA